MALCLPRSNCAAWLASRPSTTSVASITCQARVTSPDLGLYVRTVLPLRSLTRGVHAGSGCPRGRAVVIPLPAEPAERATGARALAHAGSTAVAAHDPQDYPPARPLVKVRLPAPGALCDRSLSGGRFALPRRRAPVGPSWPAIFAGGRPSETGEQLALRGYRLGHVGLRTRIDLAGVPAVLGHAA